MPLHLPVSQTTPADILFEDIKVGESKELQPKLTALDTAIASGKGIREAVMDLKAEFKQMEDDAVELKGMDDELLLGDISVHLDGVRKAWTGWTGCHGWIPGCSRS